MDEDERRQRWYQRHLASEERGRQQRLRFEALLKAEVAPALKALGFRRRSGILHWNRIHPAGRVDTIDLRRFQQTHPEDLQYGAHFGVHIEPVEAIKGRPAADLRKVGEAAPFVVPGRPTHLGEQYVYRAAEEVPLEPVMAQIIEDATAAGELLDPVDVTSLDSLLAWYDDDLHGQAFAHAAFGDLDRARAIYPRRRAGVYDTDPWPDPWSARIGVDPAPLPPVGGYVDEVAVGAAVREAFGERVMSTRGLGDEFEITMPGPITDADRELASTVVPTAVSFNEYGQVGEDFRRTSRFTHELAPLLAERERAVPELIAWVQSTTAAAVHVEVVDLDPETEAIIHRVVPDEQLDLRPALDPILARLRKRDRLLAEADGLTQAGTPSPVMQALIDPLSLAADADET